jgi:hypothetical protein
MTAHRALVLAVFLTLGPFVGRPVAADPILDFIGGAPASLGDGGTAGWKFTVTSPIAVTGLGLFDIGADGLANSHEIGLWTSGGIRLTSTTITTANSTPVASTSSLGNWRSTPITPLVLLTGDYVVGASYLPGEAAFIASATASTVPGITFVEPRMAFDFFTFPSFGDRGSTDGFFGPNLFTVAAPPVPEPKTYAMLMAGLGLLGLIARRRRKSLNAAA